MKTHTNYKPKKQKFQYYIDFRFKTSIQDTFYKGDVYISDDIQENITNIINGCNKHDDVFPKLKSQIQSFMLEDEFKYDGWEMGCDNNEDDFGLYWEISEQCFYETVKKLIPYLKYMELEDKFSYCWVYNEEKNLDCRFTFDTLSEYSKHGDLEKYLESYMTYEERQKLN